MGADKGFTVNITDAKMEFVYADELAPLLTEGPSKVTRASHVEPHPDGGWLADMRPSGGPILGVTLRPCILRNGEGDPIAGMWGVYGWVREEKHLHLLAPFDLREDALEAEREWLRKERNL